LLPIFGAGYEEVGVTNVAVSPFAVVKDMRGEKVTLDWSPASFSR
jgi:hypothetical protein